MNLFEKYIGLSYQLLESALGKLSLLQRALFVTALSFMFVFLYFSKVLLSPGEFIFAKQGDDLKNYYTLKTYWDQPINTDIIHYNSMNYPYQDIVYYSDNTPIVAMPFKWLALHGVSLNPIVAFNYLVIFNFLFASILCFLLLSKFITSRTLVVVLSVALPYFEPQSLRIIQGTENLGLSSIVLANLLLLYTIFERSEKNKSTWLFHALNYLLIVLASFVHLYYLIILCLNSGLILSAYFIWKLVRKENGWKILASAVFVPLVAFATTYTIYLLTDEFYSLRNETAMGYNIDGWKTSFKGLFSAYPHLRIRFLVESMHYINYESHTYLGSFMLYGLLIGTGVYAFTKASFSSVKNYFRQPSATFILLLLVASVASFMIALGPEYYIADNEYRINNYFNIFNLFQLFTKRVEHFRCLGRFSWLFFWAVNFCFAYALSSWLQSRKTIAICVLYFLSYLAIKDLTATGEEYRRTEFDNKLLVKNLPPEVFRLQSSIDKGHYDAILPLPFFLVGSEDHDQTLDPPSYQYYEFYFQLSSITKLPLMSSMLSRTPLSSNESIFNLFLYERMDPVLKEKLTGKKLAVILNNPAYNMPNSQTTLDRDNLRNAFYNSQKFPERFNLAPVDSVGDYILYEWRP